eukprot:703238-Rhodomonas_salina.1
MAGQAASVSLRLVMHTGQQVHLNPTVNGESKQNCTRNAVLLVLSCTCSRSAATASTVTSPFALGMPWPVLMEGLLRNASLPAIFLRAVALCRRQARAVLRLCHCRLRTVGRARRWYWWSRSTQRYGH